MRNRVLVLALVGLALAPLAAAHGALEATELEIQVLQDEASDAMETTGGFDVTQVFVGEAHDPSLGFGPGGDVVYWRLDLYGDIAKAQATDLPYRVTLTFTGPSGAVTRYLETIDGKTFKTDLDELATNATAGVVHVQRAIILAQKAGLAPGVRIKDFKVESFANGDLRDRAPGGTFVPRTGGAVEIPGESVALVKDVVLAGPTSFVKARVVRSAADAYEIHATSLLKKGSQHVMLETRPADGWTVAAEGPTSSSVGPGGEAVFKLKATGPAAANDTLAPLEVATDVGGRATILHGPDGLHAEGEAATPISPLGKATPAPALLALAALALVAAARRPR